MNIITFPNDKTIIHMPGLATGPEDAWCGPTTVQGDLAETQAVNRVRAELMGTAQPATPPSAAKWLLAYLALTGGLGALGRLV